MSYTIIQTASTSGTGSTLALTVSSTTAGNLLVLAVACNASVSSVTDNQGNIWVNRSGATIGTLWDCVSSGIGNVTTVTVHLVAPVAAVVKFREYSGVGAFDVKVFQSNTSNNLNSSASSATSSTVELVLGWGMVTNTSIPTVGAGYGNFSGNSGSVQSVFMEDLLTSSTGAQTATATGSGSPTWICGVATYVVSGTTVAIAGGGSFSFAGLGTLSGSQPLISAGSFVFTGAGTLKTRALMGNGSFDFTGLGTVTTGQPMRGNGSFSFTGKGGGISKQPLISNAGFNFTGSGLLTDSNNPNTISGSGSFDFTASGMLGGVQQAVGGASFSFAGNGVSGGTILYGQAKFDYIQGYPGIGDVFGHLSGVPYSNGSYGKPFELRAGKVLRGAAWGVVNNSSPRESYSGANIYITESLTPNAPSGNGVSDSDGRYVTGVPGGRGELSMQVECRQGDSPYPTSSSTFKARKRNRHSFLVTPVSKYSAIEAVSERGYIHVGRDKKIVTYYQNSNEIAFKSADLAADAWVQFKWDRRSAILWCLGISGTSFKVYKSTDGGQTVTEMESTVAKSSVIIADSERHILIKLYQDNSDIVYQKQSNDDGDTWSSPVAAILDGTTLKGVLQSSTYDRRPAKISVTMNNVGSNTGDKMIVSTDLGLTWITKDS